MSSTRPLIRDFFLSILPYNQRHADYVSGMHLRYVIMGELTPWIDKILTYLSDHVNNADPEPFNEHYNAGGAVLVRQPLAPNRKKKFSKTHHIPRNKIGGQAAHMDPHTEGIPSNTYPRIAHPPPTTYHMDTLTKPYLFDLAEEAPRPYYLRTKEMRAEGDNEDANTSKRPERSLIPTGTP